MSVPRPRRSETAAGPGERQHQLRPRPRLPGQIPRLCPPNSQSLDAPPRSAQPAKFNHSLCKHRSFARSAGTPQARRPGCPLGAQVREGGLCVCDQTRNRSLQITAAILMAPWV